MLKRYKFTRRKLDCGKNCKGKRWEVVGLVREHKPETKPKPKKKQSWINKLFK